MVSMFIWSSSFNKEGVDGVDAYTMSRLREGKRLYHKIKRTVTVT